MIRKGWAGIEMQIWNFKNDYSEGCHPRILEALMRGNADQQEGYGDDAYSIDARGRIRTVFKCPEADVHFVSGGTQANLIVIASALRPHESVIAASTGHIYVHEAGAIESTGHKINIIGHPAGKVTIDAIRSVLAEHVTIPHMVKPKMVYISNSTEIGTVYRKKELQELSGFCRSSGLILFCDGARLGSALCASDNDLSPSDMAELTDVFTIGGTKNGALLGEAVVIPNPRLQEDFGYHMKQHGALLSKGRLLGIQFLELFRDDLFFDLARHANAMAMKLADAIRKANYMFMTEPASNQIFPILPNQLIDRLAKEYGFYVWQKAGDNASAIRLVTSWATLETMVDRFIDDLISG